MKKDPNTYNYSSNDIWNLGKYRLENILITNGNRLFYHYNPDSKQKDQFLPALLATYLQVIHPVLTIRPNSTRDLGDMWFWNESNGVYTPNAEIYFGEHIKSIWGDAFSSRLLKPTFDNIRYETYIDRDEFQLDPQFLPVSNGTLWIHKLGDEWVIDQAQNTSELYVTSRIPVQYDQDAECPRWLQFLSEILPGQEKEITWLQEYTGYCLYRSWDYDRVCLLLGDGDNGKSTLLDVIRNLLGKGNCTTIGLYDLCNGRWYTAELYLKLCNIDADTATKDLENTSKFKTVTGGDQVMGERKGKDPFFFASFCKHFLSSNKMPYCYDDSDAFYRRWFILKFFEQFPVGDPRRDPQLKEKLLEELSGIFNWALEGLVRVLARNGFSNPPTTEENKAEWNRLSNPIYAFIYSPNVVIDQDGEYNCQEFYEDYIQYSKKYRLIIWTKDKVGKRMNHYFDFVSRVRSYDPRNPEYRPWAWKGIRKATDIEKQTYQEDYQ